MTPAIITHAGPLLSGYDVAFCDVWGVVHDGERAYEAAGEALARFRGGGGTVVLVSNAPFPAERVARVIAEKGVRRDAWDAIVSSGDIAARHVADKGYARVYCLGPEARDRALFESLPAERTGLDEADAIVCSGLIDDRNETAESYRELLGRALARRLPLVCANPDLMVDVGAARLPCAGAIAELYEKMGGEVFWAGKPHPAAYETALARAAELRGAPVARSQVLAIGDAARTDLAAARGAGIDALFIAGGLHRAEAMTGEAIDPAKLERLFPPGAPSAIAAMLHLEW
ncbi:MAG TPA: TIGR01459 family HAD-type hydrolase [Hyphomicrobiaceae bacterium]|nr:TIGR01459 family HAD-type hydrolase [Hyphomicrobiaceae bacterium]